LHANELFGVWRRELGPERAGGAPRRALCPRAGRVCSPPMPDAATETQSEPLSFPKEKIHVLLENVWASYLISAFDYRSMIDAVGNPWFGSYFDVGNNMRWGVPNHWIPFLGERIGKLDIKEYSTKKQVAEGLRAGFSVELGEGSIQWDAVREQLARIDFAGWATAEVKGGGRERLADIARRMNTVLDLA